MARCNVRFGSKADMCSALGNVRFTPESGHGRHPRAGAALIRQIDGHCASATMRGLPFPLQRGHCTSRSATRIEASVARLNAQVEIDDAVAAVAGNDQPVMFGNERGGDLRPEQSLPLPTLRLPVALHPLDGLNSLVTVGATVFFRHGTMIDRARRNGS